jgi:hypothetical protein
MGLADRRDACWPPTPIAVLPDFFAGGDYAPRPSIATLANAMDVGAPSNFERLQWLYPDAGGLRALLSADAVDDATIRATIVDAWQRQGEAICPHTACAVHVLQRRRAAGASQEFPMSHPVLTALGLQRRRIRHLSWQRRVVEDHRRRRARTDQPDHRRGAGPRACVVAGRLRPDRRARPGRVQGLAHHAGPAPRRGDPPVRRRAAQHKDALGSLVALEMGKSKPEGDGEVQEMIDIGEFAVGLSRQLYGLTMHSERPGHRMYEQWHPIGIVGIISAFNFPVAVWAWNAFVAAICGDISIWKPSPKTPLSAIASMKICNEALAKAGFPDIFFLFNDAGSDLAQAFVDDKRIPLISFTGSTKVGRTVGERVARRMGRSACWNWAATTRSSSTKPPT